MLRSTRTGATRGAARARCARRRSRVLHRSTVGSACQQVLLGVVSEGDARAHARLTSHLGYYHHELVFELNRINPSLLLHVLPTVAHELLVEDASQRNKVACAFVASLVWCVA